MHERRHELQQPEDEGDVDVADDLGVHEVAGPVRHARRRAGTRPGRRWSTGRRTTRYRRPQLRNSSVACRAVRRPRVLSAGGVVLAGSPGARRLDVHGRRRPPGAVRPARHRRRRAVMTSHAREQTVRREAARSATCGRSDATSGPPCGRDRAYERSRVRAADGPRSSCDRLGRVQPHHRARDVRAAAGAGVAARRRPSSRTPAAPSTPPAGEISAPASRSASRRARVSTTAPPGQQRRRRAARRWRRRR